MFLIYLAILILCSVNINRIKYNGNGANARLKDEKFFHKKASDEITIASFSEFVLCYANYTFARWREHM